MVAGFGLGRGIGVPVGVGASGPNRSGWRVTFWLSILVRMDDATKTGPNAACLFGTASEQGGNFTAAQARGCGYRGNLLAYHARTGRFVRVRRGLYRLRDCPSSPREEVLAAWLTMGREEAVVSHESALDLLDLSDVTPNAIHLTVPRTRRHLLAAPGVRLHTSTRPLRPSDVIDHDGVRATSATRTILDAAETGTAPEQIELAVRQAIRRGLATRRRLEADAGERSRRVRDLVVGALDAEPR